MVSITHPNNKKTDRIANNTPSLLRPEPCTKLSKPSAKPEKEISWENNMAPNSTTYNITEVYAVSSSVAFKTGPFMRRCRVATISAIPEPIPPASVGVNRPA